MNTGDMAPDATFERSDGATGRISDFRGAPLVVYFYPKDDTPGCTTEARDFSALAGAFAQIGVHVIGVSKDSTASHAKFAKKHALTVELVADTADLCEQFGVWVEKSMYGKTYMGIERATFLIDAEGRVVEAWRKVKVKGHAESVLARAREIAAQA
jgi:thioredoxin-dependent peroxiredoxin